MRKYPHYGTDSDNSFVGDIVRFIDHHGGLKPFEKDLLVNRITERYTADSVEVQIAHLAQDAAVPEMLKAPSFSDELDATPLGTAQEERQRAKLWMEDAARYARNEAYWRDKRAYPAEECVRMLGPYLFDAEIKGAVLPANVQALFDSVTSWPRPENPERYHDPNLSWIDSVVPLSTSVPQQRFNVVQEFPTKPWKELNIDPAAIKPATVRVDMGADANKKERGLYQKYNVARTDGKPLKGRAFVLETGNPNTHPALLVWAETLQREGYEKLARDVLGLLPWSSKLNPFIKGIADIAINFSGAQQLLDSAKQLIQSWLDKQGHDRCWYYPDIFRALADLFDLKPMLDPMLPSAEAFRGGCQRYQLEQYGSAAASTVVTDADVLKLIEHFEALAGHTQMDASVGALIRKMKTNIDENAIQPKPSGVLVSRERLDQLERIEAERRALTEQETDQLSKSFAELSAAYEAGALSIRNIGYLFMVAAREDKGFTVTMSPSCAVKVSLLDEKPKKNRIILTDRSKILIHFDVDDYHIDNDGFGNMTLRFSVAGTPQLKIVQGANGDYFIQHKNGLWRIEANGTIGAGEEAAASFREVLKELRTPAEGDVPSEAEKKEFLQSHQTDLGTDE